MERLFRERMDYVSAPRQDGCFLCEIQDSEDDELNLLLARNPETVVVLNRYPYNSGHLIIAPNRHVASLLDLSEKESSEIMAVSAQSVQVLGQEMSPQGFNFGANLGESAGAGLPDHIHFHIVPRWSGDTNFLPVIGGSKVLPETLEQTYRRLKPLFDTPRERLI